MDRARANTNIPDGPAWPADRNISPTVLNRYLTCPREVRLNYIDRRKGFRESSISLTKGNVAHDILKQSAGRIARGLSPLDPEALADMASCRLHRSMFPSEETRQSDIAVIVRWVRYE